MKKRLMYIFGTRPEAVKICPLIRETAGRSCFENVVCVTGQHRDMLDQVLDIFDVKPDYDLDVMRADQTLFDITREVIQPLQEILTKEQPDIVIVHGDTTTSYCAALSAFYLGIPIAHIEAGLRSHNIHSPYPEEFNRRAIALISDYDFAPTFDAGQNLIREGKDPEKVFVTGNTVVDALGFTVSDDFSHPLLEWAGDDFILITAHRRENQGEIMRGMFEGIKRALLEHPEHRAIFPVHRNPKVGELAREVFEGIDTIRIENAVDVKTFHNLEARCYLCLTDSGGVQEECPSFGRPVLVMRDVTERNEGIMAGCSYLTGTDKMLVYKKLKELLENKKVYDSMVCTQNPYGDGKACKRIADVLEERLFLD
ncbi:MAG: UDP-N-acetylglucosamine 2-epimerase (non-hydrolyzing) [Lachnospiraceae bacterium]|nr:UDP-N-acetylglucosamine 2-epimerase (non-hydrolyzing) [Lachnospiraceae bacterium]